MLIQAARGQARMTSGLRSVMHGDTRVQYFDPVQMFGKAGLAAPLQTATDTVDDLLYKYMRIYV
jgi:hypothetical protein